MKQSECKPGHLILGVPESDMEQVEVETLTSNWPCSQVNVSNKNLAENCKYKTTNISCHREKSTKNHKISLEVRNIVVLLLTIFACTIVISTITHHRMVLSKGATCQINIPDNDIDSAVSRRSDVRIKPINLRLFKLKDFIHTRIA